MSTNLTTQDWEDITEVLAAGAREAGRDHGSSQLSYILTAMTSTAHAIHARHQREDAGIHGTRRPHGREARP